MDFEFTAERSAFVAEVERFLDEHATRTSWTSPARTWRSSSTRRRAAPS